LKIEKHVLIGLEILYMYAYTHLLM